MKNDADAYRRAEKLPPAALATIRVESREDLAGLLMALCKTPDGVIGPSDKDHVTLVDVVSSDGHTVATAQMISGALVVPDCVPEFLLKDWTRTKLTRGPADWTREILSPEEIEDASGRKTVFSELAKRGRS